MPEEDYKNYSPLINRPRLGDLRNKLEQVLTSIDEENEDVPFSSSPIGKYLEDLTKVVGENNHDISGIIEDINELNSQIGSAPEAGPVSLWAGHLENKTDILEFSESLKRKADVSLENEVSVIDQRAATLEGHNNNLEQDCQLAFSHVRNELSQLSANPGGVGDSQHAGIIGTLENKINLVEKAITSLATGDSSNRMTVRAGNSYIYFLDEVVAWIDKYLPPKCPFGAFYDVYFFLEKVNQ